MNERPLAHFICPSCTSQCRDELQDGETLFQAKARLRAKMAARCPRQEATAHLCPMRSAPAVNPSR